MRRRNVRVNDRKLKILAAVIDEYILTGEPVGSKVIASKPDINVSAATVRNNNSVFLNSPTHQRAECRRSAGTDFILTKS